jgi:hypothetical protein
MQTVLKAIVAVGVVIAVTTFTHAQNTPPNSATRATLSDPQGPPPDAGHIPFTLPKDIKWTGDPARQQTAVLYGDQSKEGPYGVLIKWAPGAFSRPHFHDQTRWIYVVSGTWWVSSSNVYDERTTYPFHAGDHPAHGHGTGEDRAGRREREAVTPGWTWQIVSSTREDMTS